MYIAKHSLTLIESTALGGDTDYTPILNGRLLSIRYSSGGTLSSTAVLTAKNEGANETCYAKAIGSAGVAFRPRPTVCGSTGTTIYRTTGTANPVTDYFEFANERLKLTIGASTAAGLTGTFIIAVG